MATCSDDSVECSLSRIADALTKEWTFVDWVLSVGLPFAGVAASIFIGVASIWLARAANRISARASEAEQRREGREGREKFVAHLVEWLEVRWAGLNDIGEEPASAEAILQAHLRLNSAAHSQPGVNAEAATAIIKAADRAWDVLEGMPALEARVSGISLKNAVFTLAQAYLALPDSVDLSITELDRRVELLKGAAERGTAREQLRATLRDVIRPDGEQRSEAEIEALLDGFEASIGSK